MRFKKRCNTWNAYLQRKVGSSSLKMWPHGVRTFGHMVAREVASFWRGSSVEFLRDAIGSSHWLRERKVSKSAKTDLSRMLYSWSSASLEVSLVLLLREAEASSAVATFGWQTVNADDLIRSYSSFSNKFWSEELKALSRFWIIKHQNSYHNKSSVLL